MPLTLKGKSKARLEVQWDSTTPVEVQIVSSNNRDILLYREYCFAAGRIQLELNQLDFVQIPDITEVDLIALAKSEDGTIVSVSDPLPIQKCHHPGCGQWGHAREDGYCKHCGRRIRYQNYSYGFPKLEMSTCTVTLWDGTEGQLFKKREAKEYNNAVYSIGKYEDKNHPNAYVEILEEKYDPKVEKRYIQLYDILKQANLLGKWWQPPMACFQEEHQRTIWIYSPWLVKQSKWKSISALSYILSDNIDLLSCKDLVNIGIQLCNIATKIHTLGYAWGGLKLNDLVLCREEDHISIYLRSRDIAWDASTSKTFLDSCLVPWELFWENNGDNTLYEVTEVYVIAAILYFLRAKASNLLSYNSISYHYGLPSLKLFKPPFTERVPLKNSIDDYFESTINQALILDPQERGYQTIYELKSSFQQLLDSSHSSLFDRNYIFDAGYSMDIGDEKHEDDLSKNQDAVFTTSFTLRKKKWGIFVLCDGISTATVGSGDRASRMIVNTFRKWWKTSSEEERKKVCEYASTDLFQAREFLSSMIQEANRKISKEAKKLADKENLDDSLVMGSTVTVGLIHDGVMFFGWLGDSPIYRISSFGWERLNFEDNERNFRIESGMPLEECFIEGGNALTRCVGAHFYGEEKIEMHFGYTHLYPNDLIVICSDGIPDYIEQEASYSRHENYQMLRITSIIEQYESDTLINSKALASILVSCVNRIGGGYDNLSAILIRTLPEPYVSFEASYQRLRSLSPGMKKLFKEANLENPKEEKTLRLPRM